MNEVITPIEYKEGEYHKRVYAGKILAWYGDNPIEYVEPKNGDWELHFVDSSDYSLVARVGKYETCIEIQNVSDTDKLRAEVLERVTKIVNEADHKDLLGMLMRLREFNEF